MADYRHIMTLLLQERSYRQIASVVGCSQRAIARARRVVDEQHFTTASQVDALTGEDIERLFGDGRKSITGQFVAIDIDKVVAARLVRKKPTLKVLWAKYLQVDGPGGERKSVV